MMLLTFYSENFIYFGTWFFVGLIYFLGMSIDDLLVYTERTPGIRLGVFHKLFYYQKTVNKKMRFLSFIVQLYAIIAFLSSFVLVALSFNYSREVAIDLLSYYAVINWLVFFVVAIVNRLVG